MPDPLLPIDADTQALLTPAVLPALSVGPASPYANLVVGHAGDPEGKRLLSQLAADDLFLKPPARRDAASAALAGLWLWHDWLHESHELSQSIHSATGSYWHAVMHRREGDFGNAKYWYAKCAGHPAHARLAALAEPLLATPENAAAGKRLLRGGWDAYAFVDLVESAADRPADHPDHRLAVELQRLEWRALFAETVRQAAGQ